MEYTQDEAEKMEHCTKRQAIIGVNKQSVMDLSEKLVGVA